MLEFTSPFDSGQPSVKVDESNEDRHLRANDTHPGDTMTPGVPPSLGASSFSANRKPSVFPLRHPPTSSGSNLRKPSYTSLNSLPSPPRSPGTSNGGNTFPTLNNQRRGSASTEFSVQTSRTSPLPTPSLPSRRSSITPSTTSDSSRTNYTSSVYTQHSAYTTAGSASIFAHPGQTRRPITDLLKAPFSRSASKKKSGQFKLEPGIGSNAILNSALSGQTRGRVDLNSLVARGRNPHSGGSSVYSSDSGGTPSAYGINQLDPIQDDGQAVKSPNQGLGIA